MIDDTKIQIIDGKFSIEKYEEYGYVNNSYNYDINKIELISSEIISNYGSSEGSDIHKKYNFKLLKNEPSIICFMRYCGDKKYYEKYAIDVDKSIVYKPCFKNYNKINSFENMINNSNYSNNFKCIIL